VSISLQTDLVSILLAHGADLEAVTGDGHTALTLAAATDQPHMVTTLLAAGARYLRAAFFSVSWVGHVSRAL
jgi:ankyrin repeat protein